MRDALVEPFFATLAAANPAPRSELEYTSVFELLAAVLLSAQATDVGVNKATRVLFAVANTPHKLLALGLPGIVSAEQEVTEKTDFTWEEITAADWAIGQDTAWPCRGARVTIGGETSGPHEHTSGAIDGTR